MYGKDLLETQLKAISMKICQRNIKYGIAKLKHINYIYIKPFRILPKIMFVPIKIIIHSFGRGVHSNNKHREQ